MRVEREHYWHANAQVAFERFGYQNMLSSVTSVGLLFASISVNKVLACMQQCKSVYFTGAESRVPMQVFGQVSKGLDVVKTIESYGSQSGAPWLSIFGRCLCPAHDQGDTCLQLA